MNPVIDNKIFNFKYYKSYKDFTTGSYHMETALKKLEKKYSNNFSANIIKNDKRGICLYIKINDLYLYDKKIYFHRFYYDKVKHILLETTPQECYIKKNKYIYKLDKWGKLIYKLLNNKYISISDKYTSTYYEPSIYRKYFKYKGINYSDYKTNYVIYDNKPKIYTYSLDIDFLTNDFYANYIYITKLTKQEFFTSINNYRYITLFI